MKAKDKNCSNCKWWWGGRVYAKGKPRAWRWCRANGNGNQLVEIFCDPRGDAYLATAPNFGCVQFNAKEKD